MDNEDESLPACTFGSKCTIAIPCSKFEDSEVVTPWILRNLPPRDEGFNCEYIVTEVLKKAWKRLTLDPAKLPAGLLGFDKQTLKSAVLAAMPKGKKGDDKLDGGSLLPQGVVKGVDGLLKASKVLISKDEEQPQKWLENAKDGFGCAVQVAGMASGIGMAGAGKLLSGPCMDLVGNLWDQMNSDKNSNLATQVQQDTFLKSAVAQARDYQTVTQRLVELDNDLQKNPEFLDAMTVLNCVTATLYDRVNKVIFGNGAAHKTEQADSEAVMGKLQAIQQHMARILDVEDAKHQLATQEIAEKAKQSMEQKLDLLREDVRLLAETLAGVSTKLDVEISRSPSPRTRTV